jgi:hypothetical protein
MEKLEVGSKVKMKKPPYHTGTVKGIQPPIFDGFDESRCLCSWDSRPDRWVYRAQSELLVIQDKTAI